MERMREPLEKKLRRVCAAGKVPVAFLLFAEDFFQGVAQMGGGDEPVQSFYEWVEPWMEGLGRAVCMAEMADMVMKLYGEEQTELLYRLVTEPLAFLHTQKEREEKKDGYGNEDARNHTGE